MDVSFNTALSGMQTVIKRQEVAANNIANVNTPGFEEYSVGQAEIRPGGVRIASLARAPNPDMDRSNTDLAKQAVAMINNKNELAANARVIKTQDKMLGALLDIIA